MYPALFWATAKQQGGGLLWQEEDKVALVGITETREQGPTANATGSLRGGSGKAAGPRSHRRR